MKVTGVRGIQIWARDPLRTIKKHQAGGSSCHPPMSRVTGGGGCLVSDEGTLFCK